MQILCEKKWGVFLHTRFLHRIPESFHLAPAALLTQRPGDTSESQQHDVLRKPSLFCKTGVGPRLEAYLVKVAFGAWADPYLVKVAKIRRKF